MIWEEKGSYLEALKSNLNLESVHTFSQTNMLFH